MAVDNESYEDRGDLAPGDEAEGEVTGTTGLIVGLVLSILLTGAAFFAGSTGTVWAPAIPMMLVTFAIAQMGVHLVFFLHIGTGPDSTNNVMALAFGIFVVLLIIGGSIWIMGNMNATMMRDGVMGEMDSMPRRAAAPDGTPPPMPADMPGM